MTKTTISSQVVVPLIGMFNMCPVVSNRLHPDNVRNTIADGMLKGYLIDPKCANNYAHQFITSIDMQYNSTFYKTWSDVTSKTRYEILIDQLIHYMTTYGTDFSMEEGYVPNTQPNEPEWNTYKIVKSCSYIELYGKCLSMLTSGAALKSETVKHLTAYMIEYINAFPGTVILDVDGIKNREAMVILCDALNILPNNGQKMFAHIVYKATGETMIIKNRNMRNLIKDNAYRVDKLFMTLNDAQMKALAEVFNRYKELFLAFKTQFSRGSINKIGRLSKRYHKPMPRNFWNDILKLNTDMAMHYLQDELPSASNFTLVKVMQAIRERLLMAEKDSNALYIIRNGKVFVKPNNRENINTTKSGRFEALKDMYLCCREQLVNNLKDKACAVKFPEHYMLTCPTSEKNFIGDYPMGTCIELGQDNVIGIYWKNEWGTRDFALSFMGMDGTRVSWCNDWRADDIVYSGDLTNAPKGANEVLLFKTDNVPDGIVSVNRFNGNAGSRYRLFFGYEHRYNNFDHTDMYDYMVDPNNIKLEGEIAQSDATEQSIGVVINGKFYFYSLSCGYSRVKLAINKAAGRDSWDCGKKADGTSASGLELVELLKRRSQSMLPLNDVLLDAGFWPAETDEEVGLDLTKIDRSTLIELFS